MKNFVALTACAVLGFGLWSAAASAETFGSEGGINWFGDYDNEALGAFDSEGADGFGTGDGLGLNEDDEFGFDTEIGDDESFVSDEYGEYDSEYEWNTDDEGFDSWFGESDDLF